jgi:hypothetical protein
MTTVMMPHTYALHPPSIANYKCFFFFLWKGKRHHYIVLVDNASESTYTVISQLVLAFVNVKNIIFKKILWKNILKNIYKNKK